MLIRAILNHHLFQDAPRVPLEASCCPPDGQTSFLHLLYPATGGVRFPPCSGELGIVSSNHLISIERMLTLSVSMVSAREVSVGPWKSADLSHMTVQNSTIFFILYNLKVRHVGGLSPISQMRSRDKERERTSLRSHSSLAAEVGLYSVFQLLTEGSFWAALPRTPPDTSPEP